MIRLGICDHLGYLRSKRIGTEPQITQRAQMPATIGMAWNLRYLSYLRLKRIGIEPQMAQQAVAAYSACSAVLWSEFKPPRMSRMAADDPV